ncbi:hypothetical protein [Clostridium magnum]|uniref:Uncharacterized protein n=1 Tax=Clostridium magnum DSM 2767 TaxID=1121326 RepID=A0A161YG48_9CLOT|nr:hypothetical protein [Clostridium magnum]KZL89092.1 hypothetical protein CLMAG_55780 [Clostridium magnum DSM 2767]SHI29349.1 hypothetical protein SAMN02745944_04054 [Clostridium magnum DSM 2767]
MAVLLIITGYLIIISIEIPMLLSKNKNKRLIMYYIVFMIISSTISIFIVTKEGIPSIAEVITKILSPIIRK